MYGFIFGFQRLARCPKCTPASIKSFTTIATLPVSFAVSRVPGRSPAGSDSRGGPAGERLGREKRDRTLYRNPAPSSNLGATRDARALIVRPRSGIMDDECPRPVGGAVGRPDSVDPTSGRRHGWG